VHLRSWLFLSVVKKGELDRVLSQILSKLSDISTQIPVIDILEQLACSSRDYTLNPQPSTLQLLALSKNKGVPMCKKASNILPPQMKFNLPENLENLLCLADTHAMSPDASNTSFHRTHSERPTNPRTAVPFHIYLNNPNLMHFLALFFTVFFSSLLPLLPACLVPTFSFRQTSYQCRFLDFLVS
jgi:hypothetical protein